MKSDPDDEAFQDEIARLQGVKEDQRTLANTLSAMTGGITSLIGTTGLTDEQKRKRVDQIDILRDQAVAAGGTVGVSEATTVSYTHLRAHET